MCSSASACTSLSTWILADPDTSLNSKRREELEGIKGNQPKASSWPTWQRHLLLAFKDWVLLHFATNRALPGCTVALRVHTRAYSRTPTSSLQARTRALRRKEDSHICLLRGRTREVECFKGKLLPSPSSTPLFLPLRPLSSWSNPGFKNPLHSSRRFIPEKRSSDCTLRRSTSLSSASGAGFGAQALSAGAWVIPGSSSKGEKSNSRQQGTARNDASPKQNKTKTQKAHCAEIHQRRPLKSERVSTKAFLPLLFSVSRS